MNSYIIFNIFRILIYYIFINNKLIVLNQVNSFKQFNIFKLS